MMVHRHETMWVSGLDKVLETEFKSLKAYCWLI